MVTSVPSVVWSPTVADGVTGVIGAVVEHLQTFGVQPQAL
jgi:hypothetical protein